MSVLVNQKGKQTIKDLIALPIDINLSLVWIGDDQVSGFIDSNTGRKVKLAVDLFYDEAFIVCFRNVASTGYI